MCLLCWVCSLLLLCWLASQPSTSSHSLLLLDREARPGLLQVLYCAKKAGVTHVLRAGGAQAVAAMAWGTPSCPKVGSTVHLARAALEPAGPSGFLGRICSSL